MSNNNIPKFLQNRLEEQYGKELTTKIMDGYNKQRYTTFRVNTIKSNSTEIEKVLNNNNIKFEKTKIYENAYVLQNCDKAIIQELDIYKEGKIYLQSLSSMLPPIILNPEENIDILDMCAAPGGKTTELADLTSNKAHITACEMNKIRFDRLKFNTEKQGASSVYLMNTDARNIDNFFSFDKILLDAPCSGSGTLNASDEKISKYFTEVLIQKSIKAQTALINKAINVLKPGGELVYSTCSILKSENEEIVDKVLKTENVEIMPIQNEFIAEMPILPSTIKGTICLMPNEYFEGFFVVKLKKCQKGRAFLALSTVPGLIGNIKLQFLVDIFQATYLLAPSKP